MEKTALVSGTDFGNIMLEEEQKQLFIMIVEGIRSVPRENRGSILEANSNSGTCLVMPGSPNLVGFAYEDPDTLAAAGLLQLDYGSGGGKTYAITPFGYKYYDWLMTQLGKPVERITRHHRNYLKVQDFSNRYAAAYEKIVEAEELLWRSDSQKHFTTIGHLCREAMMDFADVLYLEVISETSGEPKPHTVKRLKAIVELAGSSKGSTVKPLMDALVVYWGTLWDLVQRQEHGAEREVSEELTWEDARRVVFQTINVMVELDRTIAK